MIRQALAASVLAVIASTATTSEAQFRGRLTSRPSIPSAAGSRPPIPTTVAPRFPAPLPFRGMPVWWPWGIVVLPEIRPFTPPAVLDGAPAGGIQLDVLPWSAQVYVDGALAGRVDQFRGYYQHLALPAGPHSIALVAEGREPEVIDVVIVPGKTLTYRTTLR
jgi:hypothetical protein